MLSLGCSSFTLEPELQWALQSCLSSILVVLYLTTEMKAFIFRCCMSLIDFTKVNVSINMLNKVITTDTISVGPQFPFIEVFISWMSNTGI